MVRDIEEVKGNTSSDKNVSTLNKVEGAIERLQGLLESFSLTPHQEQKKEENHVPESPDINLENMARFVHVRKRGGRIVRRKVKEGVTK